MSNSNYDIVIVGGGLVGLTLAYGLDQLGFKSALIEARPLQANEVTFDSRAIALAWSSLEILKSLDIWQNLDQHACPIEQIHVSEKGGFGFSRLRASDEGLSHLGAIMEITHLGNELLKAVPESIDLLMPETVTAINGQTLTTSSGELNAKLIIAADGANSSLRKMLDIETEVREYDQIAIVGNLGLKRSHQNIAYERFTPQGPMALLPLTQNKAAFVWVLKSAQAEQMKDLPEVEFLQAFQNAFGYRAGKIESLGKRVSYPLKQTLAKEQYQNGVLFLGNAVHSLHPVAGQGFNLCLRDIAMLLEALKEKGLNEEAVKHYLQLTQSDQKRTEKITNALIDIFEIDALKSFRNIGLRTFQRSKSVRSLFTRQMMGRVGRLSGLARGHKL